MLYDDFVAMLVAECEADGNDKFVQGLIVYAKDKVAGGKGEMSSLTNAQVNGKTFQRVQQFTALDTLRACRQALKIYDDTNDVVPATVATFRQITR
jgi:hypothetical protein